MIHLLQNKKTKEYYWLSVVKKANTFEENGRSSEGYTRKDKCFKSWFNEMKLCSGNYSEIVDHTDKVQKQPLYIEVGLSLIGKYEKSTPAPIGNDNLIGKEISFVKKNIPNSR